MDVRQEPRFYLGFLIIAVVMAVTGIYAYRVIGKQVDQEGWVTHTHEVLGELQTLSRYLADSQAGQCGYLITGREDYLASYRATVPKIGYSVDHIAHLTRDNPRQQAQIPALREHIERNLAKLSEALELRKSPARVSTQAAFSKSDPAMMERVQRQIDQMEAEEDRLLSERMQRWKDTLSRTRLVFLMGIGLLYILIGVVYTAMQKEASVRRKLLSTERQTSSFQRGEAERMGRIVAIQRDIARHRLNLEMAMQVITEQTQLLTRAEGSIVEMVDGDMMVYRAASGTAAPHVGLRLKAANSLSGLCVQENAVLRCDDAENDDRVDKEACRRVGLRSMVVVPLRHNGQAVGVLKVLSTHVAYFGPQDVATLELLAGVLSATVSDAAAAEVINLANASLMQANNELVTQKEELEGANARLQSLATTDGLTGLKNHRNFQERLEEEYQRATRYKTQLSLILLDVDYFKKFNDTFGHPAGDAILQQVARILQQVARTTDCVARYGGEEFALLLPETDAKGGLRTAERLCKAVAQAPWEQRAITISVGVTTLGAGVASPAELLEIADKALYQSKSGGRNRATFLSAGA